MAGTVIIIARTVDNANSFAVLIFTDLEPSFKIDTIPFYGGWQLVAGVDYCGIEEPS